MIFLGGIAMRHLDGLLLGLVALAGWRLPAQAADLADQKDRQKQIKAEPDRLVRRIETMVRVLEYNRLTRSAEKKLHDDAPGTLAGLSKEQMTALIAALEKANKTKGDKKTAELKKVQARHEQIVLGLKAVVARFDAVKNLEPAGGLL